MAGVALGGAVALGWCGPWRGSSAWLIGGAASRKVEQHAHTSVPTSARCGPGFDD